MQRLFEGGAYLKGSYHKDKKTDKAYLTFGFHNSHVMIFLQVLNNASLDVDVLPVTESSQDLTQDALYFSLCI